MANLAEIMTRLAGAIGEAKQILIVELSESRLAGVRLRPSSIWTWALVNSPAQASEWGQAWQQLVQATRTEVDRKELKKVGATSEGAKSLDAEPALRQAILSIAFAKHLDDLIIPVGALCEMKCFNRLLAETFSAAKRLPPHPELSLPNGNLTDAALRLDLGQTFAPAADADYQIRIVKLNANQGTLEQAALPLIGKGSQAPVVDHRLERKLFRALAQPDAKPAELQLIIERNCQHFASYKLELPPQRNVFYLEGWFNYQNDQLRLNVTLESGNSQSASQLSPLPANQTDPLTLPKLEPAHSVDIAFILDGTLHDPAGGKPELKPAKQFLQKIIEALSPQGQDIRYALCLYGDYKAKSGAQYTILPYSLRTADEMLHVLSGTAHHADDWDYEAVLELALHWANDQTTDKKVGWRPEADKFVIIIGYAPPHPPQSDSFYPENSGLRHEPFTSPYNWHQELGQLRQRATVVGIWTPYAPDDASAWIRHSKDIWFELNNKKPPFTGLGDDVTSKIVQLLKEPKVGVRYLAHGFIVLPLEAQIQQLRYAEK